MNREVKLRLAGHSADFFVVELPEYGLITCGDITDGIAVRFEPADPDANRPWERAPFVVSYRELENVAKQILNLVRGQQ